jgi:hypothetical protein
MTKSQKYKHLLLTKNYAKALTWIEKEGLEQELHDLYIQTNLALQEHVQPVQKIDTLANLAAKELLHKEFSFSKYKGKKYRTLHEQPTILYTQAKNLAEAYVHEYEKYRSMKYFVSTQSEQRQLDTSAQLIKRKLYFLEREHLPQGMFPSGDGFFDIHAELRKRDVFFSYAPSIVIKAKLLTAQLQKIQEEQYEEAAAFKDIHDTYKLHAVPMQRAEYSTRFH